MGYRCSKKYTVVNRAESRQLCRESVVGHPVQIRTARELQAVFLKLQTDHPTRKKMNYRALSETLSEDAQCLLLNHD